jgi:hypothetical protein
VSKQIAPAWTRSGALDHGSGDRRGAEAWLADVLARAHAAAGHGPNRRDVLASHRRMAALLRRGPRGQAVDYRNTVNRVLIPVFGALLLEDITALAIEGWRASLQTAARTRNKQLTILNGIFRRAQKRFGLLAERPAIVAYMAERWWSSSVGQDCSSKMCGRLDDHWSCLLVDTDYAGPRLASRHAERRVGVQADLARLPTHLPPLDPRR